MSKQAKNSFEQSLRSAVRRLARGNFEDSIREVIEHHHDLMQEELSIGKSEADAKIMASQRIGLIGDIAREIVKSPIRVNRGLKLQWFGGMLWILAPFISAAFYLLLRSLHVTLSPVILATTNLIVLSGIIAGLGFFRSQRLSKVPILVGLSAYCLMAVVFATLNSQNIVPESTVRKHEQMQKFAKLDPDFQDFEASFSRCVSSRSNLTSSNLDDFRKIALKKELTGVQLNTSAPLKYLYPYDYRQGQKLEMYSLGLSSTDSFEDAKLHWQRPEIANINLAAMTAQRKAYIEFAARTRYSIANPYLLMLGGVFICLQQYLIGLVLGATFLRFFIYRLDTFKLRRS